MKNLKLKAARAAKDLSQEQLAQSIRSTPHFAVFRRFGHGGEDEHGQRQQQNEGKGKDSFHGVCLLYIWKRPRRIPSMMDFRG
jgi:hypothetical protein